MSGFYTHYHENPQKQGFKFGPDDDTHSHKSNDSARGNGGYQSYLSSAPIDRQPIRFTNNVSPAKAGTMEDSSLLGGNFGGRRGSLREPQELEDDGGLLGPQMKDSGSSRSLQGLASSYLEPTLKRAESAGNFDGGQGQD